VRLNAGPHARAELAVLARPEPAPGGWRELYEAARRRAARASAKRRATRIAAVKGRELARIKAASAFVSAKLERIALTMPFLDSLHPFYRELLATMVDENEYKLCLSRLRSAARITRKVAAEAARSVLASSSRREAAEARRAFFGRLRSLLESLDSCLGMVKRWQAEMSKVPDIDPEAPSVVITGAPNVGKSSLLRAISRAKPEVKPYPFTTTNVIVGHLELAGVSVQVIDTPGLLDRPLSEKGPVERRAISALRHLKGVAVFIFDPSESCGFPLEYQLSVYSSVKELWAGKPLVAVANKVDITSAERAHALVRALGGDARELIFISALKGIGVDYLLARLEAAVAPLLPATETFLRRGAASGT